MTKIILLLFSLMVFCSGCLPAAVVRIPELQNAQQTWDKVKSQSHQTAQRLTEIQRNMVTRGYLTLDELVETSNLKQGEFVSGRRPTADFGIFEFGPVYSAHTQYRPYQEAQSLLSLAVERDYLPFKAMFYLALEKEDYEEGELIRRQWMNSLKMLQSFFKTAGSSDLVREKIDIQINRLDIVGLTDEMMRVLRKELINALKEKKWDDAQKIQTLIATRSNELRPPPPPQVVQTQTGQTTVIVPQEPSTKHIQIEHIPRYGASDVGRAVSLITRGSSNLTPKEAGTLGLLDILMKR